MAECYWFNDGMSFDLTWDNVNNWFSDDAFSIPLGSGTPQPGDDVYIRGSHGPTIGPGGSLSLNKLDTHGMTSPQAGFNDAGMTASFTVSALNFGVAGDTFAMKYGGTASDADMLGASEMHGNIGVSSFARFRDTSKLITGANITGSTVATTQFQDSSRQDGAIDTTSGVVTFSGSAISAGGVTCGTFGLSESAVLEVGTVSCTTASISGGTMNTGGGTPTIAATNVTQSGGDLEGGEISFTGTYTMTGGTLGATDFTSGISIAGGGTGSFTKSSGTIARASIGGIVNFTQSGGAISGNPDEPGHISVTATGNGTFSGGSLAHCTINCSGTVAFSGGASFGNGATITGSNATASGFSHFTNGILIGTATGPVVSGKPPTTDIPFRVTGKFRLPDFTRGKSPIGGGPIS